jgi:hypothetical protein
MHAGRRSTTAIQGPELEQDDYEGPDAYEIFHDLVNHDPDPHRYQRVWSLLHDHGSAVGDELHEAARQWLADEYTPNLDPYGSIDGLGMVNAKPPVVGPNVTTPSLPSHHYPGHSYDKEEYHARNIQHFLEQHEPTNPQTGEREQASDFPRHYPGGEHTAPEMRPNRPTIPEQTGPYYPPVRSEMTPGLQQEMENPYDPPRQRRFRPEQVVMPYGRGEPQPGEPYTPYTPVHEEHFVPRNPNQVDPEEYFGPAQNNLHQRTLPIDGVPTGEPYFYGPGNQQGQLFPGGWYVDRHTRRSGPTDLPPHLFPPERFGYVAPEGHPHQHAMWTPYNRFEPGRRIPQVLEADMPWQQNINTQHEPPADQFYPPTDAEDAQRQEAWRDRPFGEWQAKTASPPPWTPEDDDYIPSRGDGWSYKPAAGPWTDYEEAEKQKLQDSAGEAPLNGEVHHNGKIVRYNGDGAFHLGDNFAWRIPTIYHGPEDRLYVGQHGQEHADLARHMGLHDPWKTPGLAVGYIDTDGTTLPNGGLRFYDAPPQSAPLFHDWVEQQYGVRDDGADPALSDNFWSSSYHPREQDEWVDEDEPDFSVVVPEPRWRI